MRCSVRSEILMNAVASPALSPMRATNTHACAASSGGKPPDCDPAWVMPTASIAT